ncbi:DUF1684 domain-containing protein [Hymenobacter saemangeumensis]|uniref:DUF1684 domain-containing protein n=1 Tax=Hymenobacter saemangeumensis TaxID=1084522 RepID=A0ABP8IL64_9BACT
MLKKLLLAAAVLGIVLYFVSAQLQANNAETEAYRTRIRQQRREKNRNFRLSPESPLSVEQRQRFDSLKYYPLNRDWRVTQARLQRFALPTTVKLTMSDGKQEAYRRYGQVTFTGTGEAVSQAFTLTLFQRLAGTDSTLFVPFTDLSNGRETYGGGRYLDVALPAAEAKLMELDFNQAYNPYCAYNDGYSCPVPPVENRLQVAIPAGEKAFHE